MLEVVSSMLAVVCKRMQHIPTMLGPALPRGKDTAHKTLDTFCNERAWPQKCWKSCANGSKIVALRFGDHKTTEMLEVVGFKLCATTRNNMQQVVQTNTICNIQQCCVRLHGALHFIIRGTFQLTLAFQFFSIWFLSHQLKKYCWPLKISLSYPP